MLRRVGAIVGLLLAIGLTGAFSVAADVPTEATITEMDGKDVKITDLQFGAGTRRLAWLADPTGSTEDAKKGPLVLELREPHSTTYSKGIITYVPVNSIESIKYDYDKQVSAVSVKGLTEPLVGTLQYRGVNVLTLRGSADGSAKSFSGGSFAKGHIKAVTFPDAKPMTRRKGAEWLIQIDQPKAENPTLKATQFKFLYQFPGEGEVLIDAALVRKGEPLKLDESVKVFAPVALDQNKHMAAVEVQIGDTEKILILPLQLEREGKTGAFLGLMGEVDAGWKLFPLHTIKTMKRPRRD